MVKHLMGRLVVLFHFFQKGICFLALFLFFHSCSSELENEAEIEAIDISIQFDRFDLKFYNQQPDVIPELKKKYPFLFPKQFSDAAWASRQKDSLQLLLLDAVNTVFPDLSTMEEKVSHLFKHIKFYFPRTKVPQVITLINNVDYQIKTVYSDSLLLISLDTFLGKENPLYEGIPQYIRKELDQKYMLTQIVDKFSSYTIPPPEDRTFLAQLVYEGKKLYLQDLLQSHASDAEKILYSYDEHCFEVRPDKPNQMFIDSIAKLILEENCTCKFHNIFITRIHDLEVKKEATHGSLICGKSIKGHLILSQYFER